MPVPLDESPAGTHPTNHVLSAPRSGVSYAPSTLLLFLFSVKVCGLWPPRQPRSTWRPELSDGGPRGCPVCALAPMCSFRGPAVGGGSLAPRTGGPLPPCPRGSRQFNRFLVQTLLLMNYTFISHLFSFKFTNTLTTSAKALFLNKHAF